MTFLMIFFLTTVLVGLLPVLLLVMSSVAGAAVAAAVGVVPKVVPEVVGAAALLDATAAEFAGCDDGEGAAVSSRCSCSETTRCSEPGTSRWHQQGLYSSSGSPWWEGMLRRW
jgi:hypothetical protein